MESTKETPDTAASPQLATITVSAMPMVTASSCSTTSGQIRRLSARFENIIEPSSHSSQKPPCGNGKTIILTLRFSKRIVKFPQAFRAVLEIHAFLFI